VRILCSLLFPVIAQFACAADGTAIEFNRDVRPILSDKCFTCHGPDPRARKTAVHFDSAAGAQIALRGGKHALVAGDPSSSVLYERITTANTALRMPPAYAGHAKLNDREIAVIRQWIEQGAKYEAHWSFIPPVRASQSSIDSIVRARLASEDLKLAEPADPATLLRRLTLDLTGLPPTPAEVDRFLKTESYEQAVDRLLASPRYAERMTIRWLEAARYADTNGYQSDGERSMWRWRDWVLDAFQRNMRFDQFTIEQLAGDLLPNATLQQKIATGFHRNHRTNAEGGIVEEEFRVEYVADRVETTSTVWLGLTMGCSRCHDHKYDPMKQRDFYSMFAYFNNVPERGLVYNFGNEQPYIKAPTPENEQKLAALTAKVAAAESHWSAMQPAIAKAQRAWEKKLAKQPALNWTVNEGQVFNSTKLYTLDGKKGVDEGDKAKFNYMDAFTVAARIKPEATTGAILSRGEDYWEGEGYFLLISNGRLRLHLTRRSTDIAMRLETEEPLALNRWQHVLVTYDGYRKAKGVHIYIDGEERKFKVEFDELTYPFGPKEPLRIGAGGGLRFRGEIEDVRIWNRALTPEESATVHLRESVNDLARIAPRARSKAQADKLVFCFLDTSAAAEVKLARKTMLEARIERLKYDESIPTVMVMVESEKPRDAFILRRGAYDAHGEKVGPATPAFLPEMKPEWPQNRLGLARWLVDRSNPLTARVTVNRYWAMLFGAGLVKTVEDFGSQGDWPVQQDLLDWLAVEFMDSGWDNKHILKTIVMSDTYKQSSKLTPEMLRRDPENRLLARGPRIRLSAEMIRDQALAASGLLVEKMGGPSVKPYQPPGLWQELTGGSGYKQDKGDGLYRRTLYSYWKRTIAPPAMVTFDSPTRETCIVRESRTNTPLQALDLMNDVAYVEASRKLAERMLMEGGASPDSRIAYGYKLALARAPRAKESQVLTRTLNEFEHQFKANKSAAEKLLTHGESPRDKSLDEVELAAYTGIASLILNLDETVTKE
jgi:hypothetical protein